MDIPPKIAEPPARTIPLELMPPGDPATAPSSHAYPIHGLSALILVAVDSLWAIFDWVPPLWILAIPLCFFAVFIPCFLIQRFLKGDSNGRALAISTLLGVLAAIPTPITGTTVGIGVLAWSGLGKLFKKAVPRRP